MVYGLKTQQYDFQYIESEVAQSVLWENHCHAQFEMIAMVDGDINILLEGKGYRLKENQVIIIPPLFYHSVTANGKGTYRRVTVTFEINAIPEVLRSEFEAGRRALPFCLRHRWRN